MVNPTSIPLLQHIWDWQITKNNILNLEIATYIFQEPNWYLFRTHVLQTDEVPKEEQMSNMALIF